MFNQHDNITVSVHTLVLIIFNRIAKRNENDRTVFQILSLSALITGLELCDIEDWEECRNYVLWNIVVIMKSYSTNISQNNLKEASR